MENAKLGQIWIAEDESPIRRMIGRVLGKYHSDYELCFFEDGLQLKNGLDGILLGNFDNVAVIMTDGKMPYYWGNDLVKEYSSKICPIPMIVYSSEPFSEDDIKGAFSFLQKPAPMSELRETIDKALEYRQ